MVATISQAEKDQSKVNFALRQVIEWVQGNNGTFTPTIAGSGTAGTQTYSQQVGIYRKMGNVCQVWIRLTMTAKDAATAGNLIIPNLPFTAEATLIRQACSMSWSSLDLNAGGGYTTAIARIVASTTNIELMECGDNVAIAALTDADLAATTTLTIHGSYVIA